MQQMMSKVRAALVATSLCLGMVTTAAAQDQGSVERLLAIQQKRIEVLAKVEPSVCSVMALDKPGGGSGVIFSPHGFLLTNFHVTGKAKVMKIGLPDGKFHLADVIGVDPGGDISVCALRGKGTLPDGTWPYTPMGDSDKLHLGGFAYAMGNPFLLATDFKPTVTMGVISGLNRYQKGTGPNGRFLVYPDCIQVDTPINPGNSGGPLFDENGLLVGINGRITIRDRGRVNTGVGFAVSINQIKNFLPDLLAGRHTEHGTMDMNAWRMRDPNTNQGTGVFIQSMLEDSVAYEAGLRLGDQLLSFNGVAIDSANDLAREIGTLPAGMLVEVGYRRFDDRSREYQPPKSLRLRLAALDTGSKKEKRPNVIDFSARPDFKKLKAEEAKRKKAAQKSLLQKIADKILPGKKKGGKKKGAKKPKRRDLTREEALFAYMDRVAGEARVRLSQSIAHMDDSGALEQDVVVQRYRVGKAVGKPETRRYRADGERFEIALKNRTLSIEKAGEDADLRYSLERERDLDPAIQPARCVELLNNAWLEGGEYIGGRIVYVFRVRGPGKRSVFLDRDGFFPVGYRCRSPRYGGYVTFVVDRFREENGLLLPEHAELSVAGHVVEERKYGDGQNLVSYRPYSSGPLPVPSSVTEERLAPLFGSVVKIHGASGLRGIAGYGTGIVVSDKGHILTWDHVMISEGQTRVVLQDGTVCDARIARRQKDLGVVMLRIDTHDSKGRKYPLCPIELPSEEVEHRPGEFLFAMGNTFKLAEFDERISVSFGVVVATVHAQLRLNLRKFPFQGKVLIVDAPSNPGMQGAGVFTLDGKLIGMMAPLTESRETNTQLSLVLPAHRLKPFVELCLGNRSLAKGLAAKNREHVKKAPVYTGIKLFDTSRRVSPPAYIDRVLRGSPAQKVRLRPDDLIVRINDFPIRTCAEFRRALASFGPGESIDLTFKRGTKVHKVTLLLEAKK